MSKGPKAITLSAKPYAMNQIFCALYPLQKQSNHVSIINSDFVAHLTQRPYQSVPMANFAYQFGAH